MPGVWESGYLGAGRYRRTPGLRDPRQPRVSPVLRARV